MNDATTAMITGWVGKGANAILGGAGGAAAKMVLSLIFQGTTDPTADALNKINEQLLDIKGQIKELPDAVTIYQAYNQSVLDAQLKVSQFKDLLFFTARRKSLFTTVENYLGTLTDEQWKTMESFVTPGVKDNANAHITNILKTAYGVDKQDVTETKWMEIKFGDSQRSYARLRSSTDLQKLPGNFQEYLSNQLFIRDTVFLAISAIVASVQSIIHAFQSVDMDKLPVKTRKRIQERLANEELRDSYMQIDSELKVPKLHAELIRPLLFAPAYLCGNAFEIYNDILDKKTFTFKNLSTREYVALDTKSTLAMAIAGGRTNSFKQYDKEGKLELVTSFWRTKFAAKPTAWKVEFIDRSKKPEILTIKGPDLGCLFIHAISNVPGVTTKGELSNRGYCHWKLGIVPLKNSDTGHKVFCFTIYNVEKEKALVNEIPFIGSDHLGYYKLDHFDGNHQWDIQLATAQ